MNLQNNISTRIVRLRIPVPLKNHELHLKNAVYFPSLIITRSKEIKIYLCQLLCNKKTSKYYKTFTTCRVFTEKVIFELIVETYKQSINDIYGGDQKIHDNLFLTSFTFDSDTNCVYPECYS